MTSTSKKKYYIRMKWFQLDLITTLKTTENELFTPFFFSYKVSDSVLLIYSTIHSIFGFQHSDSKTIRLSYIHNL